MSFPNLFSPIRIRNRELRNRIALPATLTNYGCGHRVTERWIDFLAARARGGAGLIVSEVIAVDSAVAPSSPVTTTSMSKAFGVPPLPSKVQVRA